MDRGSDKDIAEFARMLNKLAELYPRGLPPDGLNNDIIDAHFGALSGYSTAAISRGIATLVQDKTASTFPTPGAIRRAIQETRHPSDRALLPESPPDPDVWKRGSLIFRWHRVREARGLSLDAENDPEVAADCKAFVEFYWDNEKLLSMSLDEVTAIQERLVW